MISELQTTIGQLQNKNGMVSTDLKNLKGFKLEKKEIEGENQHLKAKMEVETASINEKRMQMESYYKEENNKLKNEDNILKEKQAELDRKTAMTLQEKDEFDNEKDSKRHQHEILQRDQDIVHERNKAYEEKLSEKERDNLELHAINIKQSKKIKDLKKEIAYLKGKLSDEVAKYVKEIEFLKFDNQAKLAELEYSTNTYQEQLKVENKELKNIRALVQIILDQRSDIEHYFLDCLDLVKEGVREKRRLDDLGGEMKGDTSSYGKGEEVNVSEMEWAEKELLLRMLFGKINSGIPANFWRNLRSVSGSGAKETSKLSGKHQSHEHSRLNDH